MSEKASFILSHTVYLLFALDLAFYFDFLGNEINFFYQFHSDFRMYCNCYCKAGDECYSLKHAYSIAKFTM